VNWTRGNGSGAVLAVAAAIAGLTACAHIGKPSAPAGDRNDQGWTAQERFRWYRGSQGSRLIPYAWLVALEDKGSTTLLMDPQNFSRFGYLPADSGETATLPIGFAKDGQSDAKLSNTRLRWYAGQKDDEPWVGLNCAACHTAELTYRGNAYRVDGAPTLADFQGFMDAFLAALRATRDDPAKWDRFAARVLQPGPSNRLLRDDPANRALLRAEFTSLVDFQEALAKFNTTQSDYGRGRLDAVGHILNKVAFLTAAPGQIRGEPDAPVSYPFIWNANQHDRLQWNGIVPNKAIRFPSGQVFDVGALVRNTSEVIGVFADVTVTSNPGLKGFSSSVDIGNLNAMEDQLGRLRSPAWPAAFGAVDLNGRRFKDGKQLFRQLCAGCHLPLERTDLRTPIVAQMTPVWGAGGVGTDPWMACNAFSYEAGTGVLLGTKQKIFDGEPYGERAFSRTLLETEAVGVLLGKKWKLIWTAAKAAIGIRPVIRVVEDVSELPPPAPQKSRADRMELCRAAAAGRDEKDAQLLAYKARPLNGVWATAPYLHNGSVKSLFQILLPPARRDTEFQVGNREFDPVNVGFADRAGPNGWTFRTRDRAGRPIFGNSNEGHDYGSAQLSDEERWALVEYMKTL
jgi:processive rubber oxygenase RoxA-like protein